jgi:uncharacterized lipoprotein YddW (UPF0748 family)
MSKDLKDELSVARMLNHVQLLATKNENGFVVSVTCFVEKTCFMKMFSIVFMLLISLHLFAQPKREHRGAWIASYQNIDWPSASNLTMTAQQAELMNIIQHHKQTGINVLYLQIRSQCDAVYNSTIDPWSAVLTGTQGTNPGYDPLQFFITECRKVGIEVHAWFNPYRAIANFANINSFAANHVARVHPEWLLAYGSLRVLNPGLPAVKEYVLSVVTDVLRRYDVDGIHFDDYFYPYPQTGVQFYNDTTTYQTYGSGFANIDDWRRSNVDTLIKRTYDSVKAIKPWVKFGVSPFGIWQNQSGSQPLGSATSGLQSYSATYSNSRKWLEQNWLDYETPQIYWSIGFAAANYAVLAPWWNSNAFGRHIYTGHAMYKVNNDADANWTNPSQIPDQVRLNRTYANIFGSCFYNTKSLRNNPLGARDSLRQFFYNKPALMPLMSWRDNTAPAASTNLTANVAGNSVSLNWVKPTATAELDKARQFVVYRSSSNSINTSDVDLIRTITAVDSVSFVDVNVPVGNWYYGVTSVDRFNNESVLSNIANATVTVTAVGNVANAIQKLIVQPNPAKQNTWVKFVLQQKVQVQLQIINANGQLLKNINWGTQQKGEHLQKLDLTGLSVGQYQILLLAGNEKIVERLMIVE